MSSQVTLPLVVALVAAFWLAAARMLRKTDPGGARLARVGGILAIVLCGALIAVAAINLPISAAVAIPMFVAAIVEFGFVIAFVTRVASGRVSQRLFLICVLAIIACILLGIVLMFQPWTPAVFGIGFDLVLIALVAFMIWSHITPQNRMKAGDERHG